MFKGKRPKSEVILSQAHQLINPIDEPFLKKTSVSWSFIGERITEKGLMPSDRSGRAPLPIGPSGNPLTLEDLPPPDTVRWVIRRKAELVAAIRGGLLSLEDACERYQLSEEELQSWANSIAKHGIRGLRSTRLQIYRESNTQKARGALIHPVPGDLQLSSGE